MSARKKEKLNKHDIAMPSFGDLEKLNCGLTGLQDGYMEPLTADQETCIDMCEGLIDILSALFNVSGRDLRGPRRNNLGIARIRQIGMYVANVTLGINMTMVGRGFGRDKSTVVYACHLIEDLRDDEDFDLIICRVERIVRAAFRVGIRIDGAGPSA